MPSKCRNRTTAEVRTVLDSPAFRTAARIVVRRLGGEGMADSQLVGFYGWLCDQMSADTIHLPDQLITVHTIAIDGIERHDMVFAVKGSQVALLNPWVLQDGRNVIIDTTAWNSMIRHNVRRRFTGTDDFAELGCLLTFVAAGESYRSCVGTPGMTVTFVRDTVVLAGTPYTRYPEYRFQVRRDGTLSDIPRF